MMVLTGIHQSNDSNTCSNANEGNQRKKKNNSQEKIVLRGKHKTYVSFQLNTTTYIGFVTHKCGLCQFYNALVYGSQFSLKKNNFNLSETIHKHN